MPFDSFIKIGDIKGESKDKKHLDDIEVLSFHWGASQSGTYGKGGGGGGGKCHVENFSFVKRIDKSTPILFQKCCKGEHIHRAVFVVRKAGGDQREYLRYTFIDVILTSVRPGGVAQGEDEIPLEEVSLDFVKCEVDYHEQSSAGQTLGKIHGGWNVQENVAC